MSSDIPVFTLSAQVYALDKNQKWSPLTQDVVEVVFVFNPATGQTRLTVVENGQSVVNSTILPNMQYRKPSETFVQWFDSQHILYGLNLTSVEDADGFAREFEIANGKQPRPAGHPATVAAGTAGVANMAVNPVAAASRGTAATNTSTTIITKKPTADTPATAMQPSSEANNIGRVGAQKSSESLNTSRAELGGSAAAAAAAAAASAADAKQISQLKARIKELELNNISLEADRARLNEQVASQSKTMSSQSEQIARLEADIDKLKSAFQQNATNVNLWKQQLQAYQELNEQLSSKVGDINELYVKFGEILKRD